MIRIGGYVVPTYKDAEGVALCIYTQGCSLRCEGCNSEELWQFDGGYILKERAYKKLLKKYEGVIDTVVFTGGEPIEQPIVELVRAMQIAREAGLKVWLYTGVYDTLNNIPEVIREHCDAIKTGDYRQKVPVPPSRGYTFITTQNQRLYKHEGEGKWELIEAMGNPYLTSDPQE